MDLVPINQKPTKSEQYNGWTNYETWATNLWMTNTEENQQFFSQMYNDNPKEFENHLQEFFQNIWDEVEHWSNPTTRNMFYDIGSLWRVNWSEIAKSWSDAQ